MDTPLPTVARIAGALTVSFLAAACSSPDAPSDGAVADSGSADSAVPDGAPVDASADAPRDSGDLPDTGPGVVGFVPSLEASRIRGPAPLAVFFDATGTTHPGDVDVFRQIAYHFDFDDSDSGTWPISGESRGSETGAPLAAHVFDRPGVYEVGVRARDGDGETADAFITITVDDPDTTYAGAATVCVSRTSDVAGCPAGADHLVNATALPSLEGNRRHLFRAGQDFSTFGALVINNIADFQLGSFGPGDRPVLDGVTITHRLAADFVKPERFVIRGLRLASVSQDRMAGDFLIYDNVLDGEGALIAFGGALSYYATDELGGPNLGSTTQDQWLRADAVFIVDNYVDMHLTETGLGSNCIQGIASRLAIYGNTVLNANEHGMRIFGQYKSSIGHNLCNGVSGLGSKHCMKMHAIGTDPWTRRVNDGASRRELSRTRYVRVHDNALGSSSNGDPILLQLAPQDRGSSGTVEGLEDVISEDNVFDTNASTQQSIWTLGRRVTSRGNDLGSGAFFTIEYGAMFGGSEYPNPEEWFGPYYADPPLVTEAPVRP